MKRLKKLILENIHLKILALFISFLLWLNISIMQKANIEIISHIKVKNIPQGYKIEYLHPDMVTITIEGPKNYIRNIDISHIQTFVDAFYIKEGKNELPVRVDIKELKHFKVLKISPDKIVIFAKKN